LVFSGEKGCYHHFPESKKCFERSASGIYKYLNSGLIMGYVGNFLDMLNEVMSYRGLDEEFEKAEGVVGFYNDQTIYGRYAYLNPGKAKIDTSGIIFWTLSDEKYDIKKYASITPVGVTNLQTNTKPCLIHISHIGKFYPVLLYAADKLGLKLTNKNVDLELFSQNISESISNIDKNAILVDDDLRKAIENLFMYKIMKFIFPIKHLYRFLRLKSSGCK